MPEIWAVTDNAQTATLARGAALTRNLLMTWKNAEGRLAGGRSTPRDHLMSPSSSTSLLMGQDASQPELVCNACQTTQEHAAHTQATLERVKEIMGAENAALAEELAGARATLRTLERQLAASKALNEAERELTRDTDPKARTISNIYETWVIETGRNKRTKLTKERWDLIKAQLGNHDAADLIRAIKGAGLLPYVRFGKRYAFGAKDELATQLEHCIGPKPAGRVEANVDYYRRACTAAAEQRAGMLDMYRRVGAQADVWARLMLNAAAGREAGVEVAELDRVLWERLSVDDPFWDALGEEPVSNVVPIRSEAA